MKLYKIAAVATLALVLTGCASNQSDSKNYKDESKAALNSKPTHKHAKAKTSTNTSSTSSEASSSSSSSSSSAETKSNNSFASLSSQLASKLPNTLIPQASGMNASQPVNIKYSGNSQNSKITYSLGQKNLPLNSASASNNAYAVLTKKTYASASAAKQAVDFQPASSVKGLPKVSLSHSITGHTQSGAGQEYISWNEGRWSISVHGSKVNNTNPKSTAVSAVNMFEQYSLPAPESVGTVKLLAGDTTNLSQDVKFQKGNQVYTLKANTASAAIAMAASMK